MNPGSDMSCGAASSLTATDHGAAAGERLEDPAAGGVRQRGEHGIERGILILNH